MFPVMVKLLTIAALAAAAALSPAAAQRASGPPVVVELFSSQGCPNCPEANRNLIAMTARENILPLTYPVGYWDYLGWHDTHAKPEFAERQKAYNRELGHRGPYTPQLVFNGREHCSGVKMKAVTDALNRSLTERRAASVAFDGDAVVLEGAAPKDARVQLVHYRAGITEVTPGAGANRGKPMRHVNLVTHIETLGRWSGGAARFPANCPDGCAVLVQEGSAGAVVAAAARS